MSTTSVAPEELKRAIDSVGVAFEEFKKTHAAEIAEIKKNGAPDPLTAEKLTKIEADFAKAEDVNQKLVKADQAVKAAADLIEEQKGRIDKLEAKAGRPGQGGQERNVEEVKKAFNTFAWAVYGASQVGEMNLPDDQKKALADAKAEYKSLSVGNDTTGGYLAPAEYVMEIIKAVTEISPARSIVRVRTTGSKSIMLPKRTGTFSATRVAEQGPRSETTGLAWGMIEVNAPEAYALVDISQQNLEDSAFNLEAELGFEFVEQFAKLEGAEVVSGSGVGAAEGFTTNASVQSTNSGAAATIADADGQANGFITLFHALKTDYTRNAVWTLNRVTLGSVRKLKDADKNYIWRSGLAEGKPSTILDAPYVEMPDMPSEGANAFPVAFGDFRRAYTMVDRIGMTVLRDPLTQATSGNVRFIARRRFGGAVVLSEAIRLLKCAV